ncbi:MAG: DUF1016 domain-containing protein [Lachnospiraceae bacterium]|nr:DUF1016 domain-containing protein [Lachnospiraceae bacterium]
MNKEPIIVKSHDIHLDSEYTQWIHEIKERYRNTQIKAAVKVNSEQLLFNWLLGKDLVTRKAEEKWGTGIVEQVSLDMQNEFPHAKGFSTTNLWNMKKWFLFYSSNYEKLQLLVGEMDTTEIKSKTGNVLQHLKLQQVVGEMEFPKIFAFVPWGHHIQIITKCRSAEEAAFYIKKIATEGWSRSTLINYIESDYYGKSGGAISNFDTQLPSVQSKLAQAITKETYDLGFITLPPDYAEEDLEDALEKNITQFLLELGKGFAFVGRQKEIIVAGKARKIDMLFYHIPLKCYIVVELKVKSFEPEFAGKLNFYVNAVDELMKTHDENPTIGLLICKNMNQTEVQWAFQGIRTPMGVATYDKVKMKEIEKQLPSVEEIQARIERAEEEFKLNLQNK